MLPALRAYYNSHGNESALLSVKKETLNWVQVNGITVCYGLYEMSDGGLRQYAVELNSTACLLDWRSLTGWTGVDWLDYLERYPAGPHTVCVSAVPDTLYSGSYQDSAEWLCLRLEDVSRSRPAWAYVRRGSEAARALPPAFVMAGAAKGNAPSQRLTLEVAFARQTDMPGNPRIPMLEITHVERGWFDTSIGKPEPP